MGLDAECIKCGECCREKYRIDGRIYMTVHHCRYWDPETKLCTVFENRFAVNPACMSRDEALENHLFPEACPLAEGNPGYIGPVKDLLLSEKTVQWLESGQCADDEEFYEHLEHVYGISLKELEKKCPSF